MPNDRSIVQLCDAIVYLYLNTASEDVILQLIFSKCMPLLLYGLEAYAVNQTDLRSLDFTVDRVFMKLFKTARLDNQNVLVRGHDPSSEPSPRPTFYRETMVTNLDMWRLRKTYTYLITYLLCIAITLLM